MIPLVSTTNTRLYMSFCESEGVPATVEHECTCKVGLAAYVSHLIEGKSHMRLAER